METTNYTYTSRGKFKDEQPSNLRHAPRFWPLRRRSILETAGIPVFVTIAAILGVSMNGAPTSNAMAAQVKPRTVYLQLTPPDTNPTAFTPYTTNNNSLPVTASTIL
jgi:hypothetical protein